MSSRYVVSREQREKPLRRRGKGKKSRREIIWPAEQRGGRLPRPAVLVIGRANVFYTDASGGSHNGPCIGTERGREGEIPTATEKFAPGKVQKLYGERLVERKRRDRKVSTKQNVVSRHQKLSTDWEKG